MGTYATSWLVIHRVTELLLIAQIIWDSRGSTPQTAAQICAPEISPFPSVVVNIQVWGVETRWTIICRINTWNNVTSLVCDNLGIWWQCLIYLWLHEIKSTMAPWLGPDLFLSTDLCYRGHVIIIECHQLSPWSMTSGKHRLSSSSLYPMDATLGTEQKANADMDIFELHFFEVLSHAMDTLSLKKALQSARLKSPSLRRKWQIKTKWFPPWTKKSRIKNIDMTILSNMDARLR